MTNLTTRMMIAAATLVVAAGVASAQTMKAEIPFAFRVGTKTMAPGTYMVTLDRSLVSVPVLQIRNVVDHRAAMAPAQAPHDPPKAWRARGNATLAFQCYGSTCSLRDVWTGDGHSAYSFAAPKPGDEPVHVALVEMSPTKGD